MYIEVIISDSNILESNLNNCFDLEIPASFQRVLIQNKEQLFKFLAEHSKIDLLIIDSHQELLLTQKLLSISNNIVNLSQMEIIEANYVMSKPIRLNDLLEKLNQRYLDPKIFRDIRPDIIFDEARTRLVMSGNSVKLTEKEMILIKALLLAKSHKIKKDDLLAHYWHYDADANTSTIDAHIFKLKQKVPSDLLENKDGAIIMHI